MSKEQTRTAFQQLHDTAAKFSSSIEIPKTVDDLWSSFIHIAGNTAHHLSFLATQDKTNPSPQGYNHENISEKAKGKKPEVFSPEKSPEPVSEPGGSVINKVFDRIDATWESSVQVTARQVRYLVEKIRGPMVIHSSCESASSCSSSKQVQSKTMERDQGLEIITKVTEKTQEKITSRAKSLEWSLPNFFGLRLDQFIITTKGCSGI